MAKKGNITTETILSELKSGIVKPVYFLMGEEPFFIDLLSNQIVNQVLTETDKEFDLSILYGKDTNIRQILGYARQYPMLAKYKVILIREAQDLKDIDDLALYLEKSMPTTILIFNHKYSSLDKRKKITSIIDEKGLLFESKKLYESELPRWITQQSAVRHMKIDERTATLLADYLGSDLSRITGALDKLKLSQKEGADQINSELIEKHIGISREFNDFELQNAIVTNNYFKATKIATFYSKNPRNYPIQKTIALLGSFFTNLMLFHYLVDKSPAQVAVELGVAPFRVRELSEAAKNYNAGKTMQIISLLRDFDARSKGFDTKGISDAELLKELLFKIMHNPSR
jgi:DNA polymerase III subunit delta